MMVQLALDFDGAAISLGAFATSRLKAILEALGRRMEFEVEGAQLESRETPRPKHSARGQEYERGAHGD